MGEGMLPGQGHRMCVLARHSLAQLGRSLFFYDILLGALSLAFGSIQLLMGILGSF